MASRPRSRWPRVSPSESSAGTLNGVLVTRLKIPSLIATLATASVATGLAFAVTGGVTFVGRWDPAFLALGRGSLLGVPVLILWTAGSGGDRGLPAEADAARPAHDVHGRSRRSGAPVRDRRAPDEAARTHLLGGRGGPGRRAADGDAQFRRAQHGDRLPAARDRRGAAGHDDVRTGPLQRRAARSSARRPSACSATASC